MPLCILWSSDVQAKSNRKSETSNYPQSMTKGTLSARTRTLVKWESKCTTKAVEQGTESLPYSSHSRTGRKPEVEHLSQCIRPFIQFRGNEFKGIIGFILQHILNERTLVQLVYPQQKITKQGYQILLSILSTWPNLMRGPIELYQSSPLS